MTPEEHLRAGNLAAALAALQDRIRGDASNPKLRIFLFQLLCVMGDWKRAVAQLKLSGEMSAAAVPMAQTYREAIICELLREKVFSGEKDPLLFGKPQEWLAKLAQSLKVLAAGNAEAAADLRAQAFEAAPTASGMINGQAFEWVADADMRLGPVLEAVINGKYFWLPFSSIRRLDLEPPADLRDTVWMPATLTLRNGGEVVALLPARYPGTASHGTDAQKLGRATDWLDAGGETWVGRGQKILTTEAGDVPLMEVRSLTIVGDDAEVEEGGDAAEIDG